MSPAEISRINFIDGVTGWPFDLPVLWRRLWLVAFPVTVPIWLVGCILLALPVMIYDVAADIVSDLWR